MSTALGCREDDCAQIRRPHLDRGRHHGADLVGDLVELGTGRALRRMTLAWVDLEGHSVGAPAIPLAAPPWVQSVSTA